MLTIWRFLALVLGALALTMTSAHVLEMPQKMSYTPEMYSAVNTTLYRYFAVVGSVYQLGGIVAAAVMTALLRRHGLPDRWALAGTSLLVLSFVSWVFLVAPVNQQIAAAIASARETVPSLWVQLRGRWEYGHLTGFVLQLAGFCALVASVAREAARADRLERTTRTA